MENVVAGLLNRDKKEFKTPGKNGHYKGGFYSEDDGIGIVLYGKEEVVHRSIIVIWLPLHVQPLKFLSAQRLIFMNHTR
jgi:hypothetical protein